MRGIARRVIGVTAGVQHTHGIDAKSYAKWSRRYDTLTRKGRRQIRDDISGWTHRPLISVIMPVRNPRREILRDAIESVRQQLYPNWELFVVGDTATGNAVGELLEDYAAHDFRIKPVPGEYNGGPLEISHPAFQLAQGDFIALLHSDDILREHALYWVVRNIAHQPDVGLIYSDEDRVDGSGRRYDPNFKPDWNYDLFLSCNLIGHFAVYRASLVKELNGFREGLDGAQDYDLALRCIERLDPGRIVHIPRVLYHRRDGAGNAGQPDDEVRRALLPGERALNEHFARLGVAARAELLDFGAYRTRYAIPQPSPLVSLIIPTRNGLDLIRQCIGSIFEKTVYEHYEIIVVDNNSDDPQTLAYLNGLVSDGRIRVLRDERPFNYSALNNAAVAGAAGEYVALINNDIEVITPEWLNEMIGLASQPGVGAVGARLWYPDDTLQHGGVITGVFGVAGHSHRGLAKGEGGYFERARVTQALSAVTAACLVIKKAIFEEVGGLDEDNLGVAFNDVDFCLRVREAGYRNVWTPYAELYHHESATRGSEDTPEKRRRFDREAMYMATRWREILENDPAYNPNLTLARAEFSLAWPPRVPSINGD